MSDGGKSDMRSDKCACDELTKSWRWEDRAALCGHLKECPLFHENFESRAVAPEASVVAGDDPPAVLR